MKINFSVPLCNNPISGLIHCIISPCNIAIDLNTPCVAGCCGPELKILKIKFEYRIKYKE